MEHELDLRKGFFPKLMKHIRWPLVSTQYIQNMFVEERLFKNNSQGMYFFINMFIVVSLMFFNDYTFR